MKLTPIYPGREDPFEGDRTIWLRALPVGAQVTSATLTLTPVKSTEKVQKHNRDPEETILFEEIFTFENMAKPPELLADTWGVGKIPIEGSAPSVEVDFHARRTLGAIEGTGGEANLKVDMGGAFVEIASDGTLMSPEKKALTVNLNSDTSPLPGLTVNNPNLPGLTVNKFRLTQAPSNTSNLNVTKVIIRSTPTNISVRLGQMPPFWNRPGELATSATSPDFATMLNAFLKTTQPQNGFYQIPFTLHSDAIARLDITLDINYTIEQSILPTHLSELTLDYGLSTLPSVEEKLTTLKLPRGARVVPGKATAKITGEFQPTRIAVGAVGADPQKTFVVEVSPNCAIAQLLESDQEIEVTAIDLPLANTKPGLAGLSVSIQADADGKPSGEVLASAEVQIAKPLPGQSSWGSATLPTPFRILKKERRWLILQSQSGQAYWWAVPALTPELALQCSRNDGLSWRTESVAEATTPLTALFRLRHIPDRFTIPVQLQIGKGDAATVRHLDDFAPLGRIEFDFDFAEQLREYLDKSAPSLPCSTDERLINGSFEDPPADDATRRLFGFDAGQNYTLEGQVDLNRGINLGKERFITVSVGKGLPIHIDCADAGKDPVKGTDLVKEINLAMRQDIASYERRSTPRNPNYYGGYICLEKMDSNISLHPWLQKTVPQGWQQPPDSQGKILRLKLPIINYSDYSDYSDDHKPHKPMTLSELPSQQIAVVLDSTTIGPALLTQQVPVQGNCTYRLQFRFTIITSSGDPLPTSSGSPLPEPSRWQVNWLRSSHQILQQDEGTLKIYATQPLNLSDLRLDESVTPDWKTVEVQLQAPENAVQAEIRFIQPLGGGLVLDDVSFASTPESLSNPNLLSWQESSTQKSTNDNNSLSPPPYNWTIVSGWIDVVDSQKDSAVKQGGVLNGSGPEDAVLSQTVPLQMSQEEEVHYQLLVNAHPIGAVAADIEQRSPAQLARVELHWSGASSSQAIVLPLDGRDFPDHGWSGPVPAGTTKAEIRLIQPRHQGQLQVNSVSLSKVEMVSVPLTFLAESPGQLTISNLRVTYD